MESTNNARCGNIDCFLTEPHIHRAITGNPGKKEPVLKDFEITLRPNPFTTVVAAEYPWQAIRIAEENYGNGIATEYGFDIYTIKAITPEEARQKYLATLKK